MNHNWRIKRQYYNLILQGNKTLEVRVGYPEIKKVQIGDTITFKEYSNIKFEVTRIAVYEDFPEMLDCEESQRAIPGVTKYRALEMYQAIYDESKEALGVYVFELKKNDTKLITLSSIINNHKLFGKYANIAYMVTDKICTSYPNHFNWYWGKEIPRVLDGSGEIIICTIDNNVVGVAFLKKDTTERKICTICVVEEYRGRHIATKMLEIAFKFLKTTKPMITISDDKLQMFEHIIKKYGWIQTQITEIGYYNNDTREIVFNGQLPNR